MTRRKLPSRGHSHLCSRFVLVKSPLLCSAITPLFFCSVDLLRIPGRTVWCHGLRILGIGFFAFFCGRFHKLDNMWSPCPQQHMGVAVDRVASFNFSRRYITS